MCVYDTIPLICPEKPAEVSLGGFMYNYITYAFKIAQNGSQRVFLIGTQ